MYSSDVPLIRYTNTENDTFSKNRSRNEIIDIIDKANLSERSDILKLVLFNEKYFYIDLILNNYDFDINFDGGVILLLIIQKYIRGVNLNVFNMNAIKSLIDKGADITINNFRAWRCIADMTAGINCFVTEHTNLSDRIICIMDLFISLGIDPNILDNYAIKQISKTKYIAVMQYLLQFNVDINCNDGHPIINAIHNGNYEMCQLLLDNGANINPSSHSLLIYALKTFSVNPKIIQLLIDYDVDVDKLNTYVLESPIKKTDQEIIDILLSKNVPIETIYLILWKDEKH